MYYHVIFYRVRVTIFVKERQQYIPSALLIYIFHCQQRNIEYVAMETQQCFLCIVALRMLLPTA
jgi:hypothetical protein